MTLGMPVPPAYLKDLYQADLLWQDAVFVLLQFNLLGECFFSQDSHILSI